MSEIERLGHRFWGVNIVIMVALLGELGHDQ